MYDKNSIPAIVSINQLCSLMSISRSRYYQLLSEGLLYSPVYTNNKRPYFTRESAIKNLEVKKNNVGANGKICIFYNSISRPVSSPKKAYKKKEPRKKSTNEYADLIDGLSSLGIECSSSQIEATLKKCFPDGTDQIEEGEILRQVFCQIKEQNSTDNVNG